MTVSTAEQLTWGGVPCLSHNVCCLPDDSEAESLPAEGRAVASYGPDEPANGTLVPSGETDEHTVAEAGEYVFSCVTHGSHDMGGPIHVG